MASRRTNRFVSQEAPDDVSTDGSVQRGIEERYTLEEAVVLFKKERNDSALLASACDKAESLLTSGQVDSEADLTLDHDSKVAIVVYTLESPNVYMDFNSRSRKMSVASWESFPYKGMWLLINMAISSYERPNMQNVDDLSVQTVYRGISTLVNVAIGSNFYFRQITSTSLSADVAYSFSSNGGTLFIIKTFLPFSIKNFSPYPAEEEVMISGLESFLVKNVEDTNSGRKIYLQRFSSLLLEIYHDLSRSGSRSSGFITAICKKITDSNN